MKKNLLIVLLLASGFAFAQTDLSINADNSWFKLGLEAGLPIGDTGDAYSFNLGLEVRAQYLVTPNFAIGGVSGYTHFFGKTVDTGFGEVEVDDLGIIPLAAFARYYLGRVGFFFGADLGYGYVVSDVEDLEGGLLLKPHVGWHNDDWNFYAFYQNVGTKLGDETGNVETIGLGASYNFKFK